MGLAAIQKSTGRLIEWQSRATPGTCFQNAINSGFAKDDIEEREMTGAEAQALIPRPPKPLTLSVDDLADLLVEKKLLTKSEVDGKKK